MPDHLDGDYQYHRPTMMSASPPPQKNRTGTIIAFAVAGVALIIALAAVALAIIKTDSSDEESAVAATQVTTQQTQQPAAPATVTQTQTETQTVAPPPAPARNGYQAANAAGYTVSCPNSNVLRSSSQTTCPWATTVAYEVNRRGSFSGVPIYSATTGTYVSTRCWDEGDYYVCKGNNHPFAVVK